MKKTMLILAACFLCGATAGRAEDKPNPKKEEAAKKDPKDMTLDELEAAQLCPVTRKASKPIYHVKLGDKEYHFASKDARAEFEAHPEKHGYKKDPKK
jgi:hypothetical protein